MNAPRDHPEPAGLPMALRHQLQAFRRHLWRVQGLAALSCGLAVLMAGFLVVFAGDRLTDLPAGLRGFLFALTLSAIVICGARWLWCWVIPHRSAEGLVRYLEGRNPSQGDAVAAALDLSEKPARALNSGTSPQLRAAALAQTTTFLNGEDLSATVPTDGLRRASRWALILVGVTLGIAFFLPRPAYNAGKRFALPWIDTPRFTFARLAVESDARVVAENEPFDLEAQLDPHSDWRPPLAKAVLPDGTSVTAWLEDPVYRFPMAPFRVPRVVQLRAGDARARLTVIPMPRPGLTALEVDLQLPVYLQRPRRTLDGRSGRLEILPGSLLEVRGKISRPLAEIIDGTDGAIRWTPGLDGHFAGHPFAMGEQVREIELTWKDRHGLANAEPFRLSLAPAPDRAPTLVWRGGTDYPNSLLIDDTLLLSFGAEDDYGLREAGLLWAEEGAAPEAVWAERHRPLFAGHPERQSVDVEASFSPASQGLSPGRFQVWAYAVDYLPGRRASFSAPLTVTVLDPAQHAAMVRDRFEGLRLDLEEIARREEQRIKRNKDLSGAEESDWRSASGALEKSRRAEERDAEALEKLRDDARQLFSEAMKNRELDNASLAPWSAMVAAMTAVAESDMPAAAGALGRASAQAASAAGGQANTQAAKASLDEAIGHQEAAMEKLAASLDAAAETEGLLQAATFVNRLRRAAEQERSVAERSLRQLANTAGLGPAELDATSTAFLHEIGGAHKEVILSVDEIRHDLEHYALRTGETTHRQLARTMSEPGVGTALRVMLDRVSNNQAAQLRREALFWANQLEMWAQTLAPGTNDEDGTASGGGATMAKIDLLLALMRLVQSQTELRERTRRAESVREENPGHASEAAVLAADQLAIGHEAARLSARVFDPQTHAKLQNAGRAISDALRLLQAGNTGGETIAAQTEVIEWLGRAGESSKGGAQDSEGVEALLEMMTAMQIGAAPGGNPMGQASALAAGAAAGEANEAFMEERRGEGASSRGGADLPEEFREAIGAYFERVDALEQAGRSNPNDPSDKP